MVPIGMQSNCSIETRCIRKTNAHNCYLEIKRRATERNNHLWTDDLMSIPYHLQTFKLSYGWVKINEQTEDEQGEKTAK